MAQEDYTASKILEILRFGSKKGDANGIVGLGFAHAYGIGVEVNHTKAVEQFNRCLSVHSDAGFYMGEILMRNAAESVTFEQDPRQNVPQASQHSSGWRSYDLSAAIQAYSQSANLGHALAQHRLAHLTSRGIGTARSCESAVFGFKAVAERGVWAQQLNTAHNYFGKQDYARALHLFTQLAAIGFEIAQFNAAFILSKVYCPPAVAPSGSAHSAVNSTLGSVRKVELLPHEKWTSLKSAKERSPSAWTIVAASPRDVKGAYNAKFKVQCEVRALSLFGLSAAQGNSDALVLVGDFYYYGLASLNSSRWLASSYYQRAADLHNTHAIFNLGLMHEVLLL